MIDWERLNGLRADIGEDDFADVAFLFVTEIGETLDRLHAAPDKITAADFHFLRGSAANLGFTALADACNKGEADCIAQKTPDINGVMTLFKASLAEVSPQMPELAAAA